MMDRRLRISVFLTAMTALVALCALLVTAILAQTDDPNRAGSATSGRPDLSGLPANEVKAIENACSGARQFRGPASYYQCLKNELAALQRSPGRPDLSGLPTNEVKAIENACSSARQFRGPASYYQCLQHELAALQKFLGPSSKSLNTSEPAAGLASRPIDEPIKRVEPARKENSQKKTVPAENAVPPKEERRTSPSPSAPPPISRSAQPTDVNRIPEKTETNPFSVALGFIILFLIGRAVYHKVPTKRCIHCSTWTRNNTRVCDACQSHFDNEKAKAQERERQEREGRIRAEEGRKREEARTQEQRKRDEDARQKKPTSIADLQRLTGDQFESLVASLFERDGYKVTRRGGSGDEGIDIILHLGMEKDVVQCKRWKSDIGSPVIREFYGSMMHVGARHGFVITTASFSSSAREFSAGKPIILIDGQYLLSWINGAKSTRSDTGARTTKGDGFDPYEVLQVNRGASKEEIKAAYFKVIKQYHPDKVSHLGKEFQEIAKEKTQAINRAYEMLTSR